MNNLLKFILFILFQNLSFATTDIIVIGEDYKPLSYLVNNELKGPSVDIINILMMKLNVNSHIIAFPWKRGYVTTLKNENTALFSTNRTKEREHLFKWVGPIAQKEHYLYALSNFDFKVNKLIDVKNYTIGVERGTVSEQVLLASNIDNLSKVNFPRQNLGMLLKKRIDLWCISSSTFHETLKEEKINPIKLKKVYKVMNSELYIAFNKNTSDEVIKLWQNELDKLYEEGIIKSIFKKYDLMHLYINPQ